MKALSLSAGDTPIIESSNNNVHLGPRSAEKSDKNKDVNSMY